MHWSWPIRPIGPTPPGQAIATLALPQASGGSAPYTYTLTAATTGGTLTGSLPAGLSFNASTRTLTGTPTAPGTYTLTYTVTDSRARSATQTFTLRVVDALALTDPQEPAVLPESGH